MCGGDEGGGGEGSAQVYLKSFCMLEPFMDRSEEKILHALTLKVSRKNASENVICCSRLLQIIA